MCGIAGILTLIPEKINVRTALLHMSKKLKHRGPDDEGFFLSSGNASGCFSGDDTPSEILESKFDFSPEKSLKSTDAIFSLGFCHRRLSIIDLSAGGHQPMCIDQGKIWLTFNGEIYNYVELRAELEETGHRFITRSDTEVLLKAYRQWGVKCLEKFNGMFSFVLYDTEKNTLFGARDRAGVKPFYYYHTQEVFCFASEQKALVSQPFVQTGINEQAVCDFLVNNEAEYETEGMFRNILELFPGNYFELNIKTLDLVIRPYYRLSPDTSFEQFDQGKFEVYKKETEELIVEAVRIRMRSDVKVGSCLSGGVDSSAIAGIMQQLSHQQNAPQFFTAVFPGSGLDEEKWAAEVVKNGGDWHRVNPSAAELFKDLDDLVYSQDLPLWSSSTYAQYRVMKLAKEAGVKVLLDGQGGDELFGGYIPYYLSFWNELKRNGDKERLTAEMAAFAHLGSATRFSLKENLKGQIENLSPFVRSLKDPQLKFLNKDFLDGFSRPPRISKKYATLNEHMSAEFSNTRLKLYLKCEDRCSMWHSVESRTPFADDLNLVNKVYSLPGTYKISKGQLKFLMREAIKKYIPPKIYERKDKLGYVTPHNQWMRSLATEFQNMDYTLLKPYLNMARFEKSKAVLFSPEGDKERFLAFKIITFNKWRSLFEV